MKTARKHETLQESFERVYGKTVLSKPVVEGSPKTATAVLSIPFGILRYMIRFCFLGPNSEEIVLRPLYSHLSGVFLSVTSILAMLFINDIENWFRALGWEGGFMVFIMGFVAMYSIVQLLRGFAFIGGCNLFMSGIKSTAATVLYSSKRSSDAAYRSRERAENSDRGEIDEFLGYANSKMMWMSNENKEKYISKLFGGKK